jgi:branched-chain amino acid transport system ATP-binding protein
LVGRLVGPPPPCPLPQGEGEIVGSMLRLENVSASYRGLRALQGVSLEVARGEIVAVVGANGAGKSTLLKSIAGLVATDGSIEFEGQSLRRVAAHRITRMGVSMVPEGRRLFPRLSVEDNLRLGAYARRGMDRFKPLELVFSLFPRLRERLAQRAETLSGGEQQMLAIGRALMTQPRFLMLDEPSQGIMPRLVDDILAAVERIRDLGVTVLLVEQRLVEALAIADRAYVLQTGRIVMAGPAAAILADGAVRKAYLGM